MFDDSKANMGVFVLLELACIDLCKFSFVTHNTLHTQKKPPLLYDRFIYNTMVWGMYIFLLVFAPIMKPWYPQYRCLWKWGPTEELWILPSHGRTISPAKVTLYHWIKCKLIAWKLGSSLERQLNFLKSWDSMLSWWISLFHVTLTQFLCDISRNSRELILCIIMYKYLHCSALCKGISSKRCTPNLLIHTQWSFWPSWEECIPNVLNMGVLSTIVSSPKLVLWPALWPRWVLVYFEVHTYWTHVVVVKPFCDILWGETHLSP